MSDTNILPNDQNFVRAAGFESSSTPGLVMAGQIDEITGRILVDNAGGGVATEITVANEATDTTCFPVFVTAATGDLEPKSNAGLTFNSNTARLNSTILASSSLTATEIVITDASKNLVSAAVATYPSLTELTYLKGVTSAIQTQINGKQASGSYATLTGVETLTNKRITQRVVTTTDDATSVINVDTTDVYELSAVANNTEFTVTGTPTDGQKLLVRYKDAGVSKTLTWTFATAIGITLPTATTANKWGYVGCVYNLAATAWHAVAVSTEA